MKSLSTQSLTELAEAAFLQAAHKVVERAIATGTPVILWENGAVKEVDPRTIRLPPMQKRRRDAEE